MTHENSSPLHDWEETENERSSEPAYRVQLEGFEGPLDLLLHLIKKEQVSIYDIPIARITEQYLQHLCLMQEMNLAVASDFLVLAATLIYIKSKMLLPRDPASDTPVEDDPRRELVDRLLEYQKFKAAAEVLWSRAEMEQGVFVRGPLPTDDHNPEVSATAFDLFNAFQRALERRKEILQVEIARDEITMAEKLDQIRELLSSSDRIEVDELFERAGSRREMVITFLALLELVRQTFLRLVQQIAYGRIYALRVVPNLIPKS
ncbi:MAG: segregation/condensation protein A [Acidobacteria bacterium]|nr:segregation/condensation protein A [Acidobacteriota bacterium]